jgi:hypothetical protein
MAEDRADAEGRVMVWTDWRPDAVQRPDYPPQPVPVDFGPGHDPGDADDLGNTPVYWRPASDLTDEAKRELRRCAEAFENTAGLFNAMR